MTFYILGFDSHIWLMYTSSMVRTQIYIPENIHQQLMSAAQKNGASMAQLVRDFIEAGLKKNKTADQSGKAAVERLLRMSAKGASKNLSTNLDQYLYG